MTFADLEAEIKEKLSKDPAWVQIEESDMPEYEEISRALMHSWMTIVCHEDNQLLRSLWEAAMQPFRRSRKVYWWQRNMARELKIVSLNSGLVQRVRNELACKEILELRKRIRELEEK